MARRNVRRSMAIDPTQRCPCGLAESYGQCCGLLHSGRPAPTAELLMRSRFTAFVTMDADYLMRTWHPATRPGRIQFDPARQWLRLQVIRVTGGGLLDHGGTVEFRADYRTGTVTEHSRFVREHGLWVYLGPVPWGQDHG